MARKKPLLEKVEVEGIANKGKSVARSNGRVLFIKDAIPGDVINFQTTRKKKKYWEGFATDILSPSKDRKTPFCKHFEACGGCKWQNMSYSAQLKHKAQTVTDAFERLAGIEVHQEDILPAISTKYYRNRLDFGFSDKRWLTRSEIETGKTFEPEAVGFHVSGHFDKILHIDHCHLQASPSNDIRNSVYDFAKQHNLSFYNAREHTGLLRSLIIRNSLEGDLMVLVMFGEKDDVAADKLNNFLISQFPSITSLYNITNTKKNDTFFDQKLDLISGKPYMTEVLKGKKLRFGPKSFFQTNSAQANKLVSVVEDFAELKKDDHLYDLYCGVGSIGIALSEQVEKLSGIETVPEAIEYAKENASINKIKNAVFHQGQAEDLLSEDFFSENGKPDVIITDPPRVGLHKNVCKVLNLSGAGRILYVSCNPSTQARDMTILSEAYNLIKIKPVDMFPHTHHVENVALLKRK